MIKCSYVCKFLVLLKLADVISARPYVPNLLSKQPNETVLVEAASEKEKLRWPRTFYSLFNHSSDDEIFFPDDDEEENLFKPKFPDENLFKPKISGEPKCQDGNYNFCEDADAYPYKYVKNVLQKNKMFANMFDKDVPNEADVSHRLGGDDNFVCGSRIRNIFPRVGKNQKDKWRFIINQDDFVQSVQIEVCRDLGGPCDIIGELPNGYVTSCKQKYVYTRLLSVSDNGNPYPDVFPLPSACCCSYKRDIHFLARYGAPTTPENSRKISF